jgi:hypothetical protein
MVFLRDEALGRDIQRRTAAASTKNAVLSMVYNQSKVGVSGRATSNYSKLGDKPLAALANISRPNG